MAEYKLSYTAAEIDQRIGKVGQLSTDVSGLQVDTASMRETIKATQSTVDELSADVAYISEEDNENITDVEDGNDGNRSVSWNDLEDKPFDKETSETAILQEQELAFEDDGYGGFIAFLDFADSPTKDCQLKVMFDGNQYVCSCVYLEDDFFYFGNGIFCGEETDTDEPFCLLYSEGEFMCLTASGYTHNVGIIKVTNIIHHLNNEYLSQNVAKTVIVTINEITYDDNSNTETGKSNLSSSEILALFNRGYFVYVRIDTSIEGTVLLPLTSLNGDGLMFSGYVYNNGGFDLYCVRIYNASSDVVINRNNLNKLNINNLYGITFTASSNRKTYALDVNSNGDLIATEAIV